MRCAGVVWFPPLEANQGFLSLAAIVIAVGLAFAEYVNARRERFARTSEPAILAIEIIDGLIVKVLEAIATERAKEHGPYFAGRNVRSDGKLALEAIESIQRALPPSASFALAMAGAVQTLKNRPEMVYDDLGTAIISLEHWLDWVRRVRASIEQTIPRTFVEKIGVVLRNAGRIGSRFGVRQHRGARPAATTSS